MAHNKEQDALKAELKMLLKRPENARCADCNTQGPTWASTNLGVFVCMRCSGIHRSLGTHISKVKSTVLDNWQPHMVARMAAVGNEVAKAMYEHGVPKSYPRNFNDQHQLVSWINNKYHHKKWFNEAADPDLQGESDEEGDTDVSSSSHTTPTVGATHISASPSASGASVQHAATPGTHGTQMPGRFVVSAPSSPLVHAHNDVNLFSNPSAQFAQFDAFNTDLFATPAAQSGASQNYAFPALSTAPQASFPSHTLAASMPASPSVPSQTTHTEFKGASTQTTEDLFNLPLAASHASATTLPSSAATPALDAKPQTVDKSQLMSMYSSTPFGQQQHQQQRYNLQQQAFLAQQQQFQHQMLMNGSQGGPLAPQPHHAASPPSFAPSSAFAPSPAFSSPLPSSFTGNAFTTAPAMPAPGLSANAASLASLYASSPSHSPQTIAPQTQPPNHYGQFGTPAQSNNTTNLFHQAYSNQYNSAFAPMTSTAQSGSLI